MSSMDTLYKRNSYSDGENQYDGGDLAGDSQLKSVQNTLQTMVVRFTKENTGKSILTAVLSTTRMVLYLLILMLSRSQLITPSTQS